MFTIKRTDADGTVFFDAYDDQDEAGRDVLAAMNTIGVKEIVIEIKDIRTVGFGACDTDEYPRFGAEEFLEE